RGPAPANNEGRFEPVVPMKLLEFPAFETTTYTVASTDPLTATTMSYTATIGKELRINACGEPVFGIAVHLTDGRIDGPLTNVEFTATYVIATQYGGVFVRDAFVLAGREGVDTVSRDNLAVINEVPVAPLPAR
ncbi:MAG: hypothetical protein LC789_10015, partial [Actinobacteria bacterium]|nr:hypothetical protein [Actinomycetota bacterium]